ncbi:MAG: hypothetical protein QNJ29_11790 [Rhizobiaceae bacterium]|nr:hypothetical protein [Rhizobiaceae bacterium]
MIDLWFEFTWLDMWLVPIVIAAILILMYAVRYVAGRYGLGAELQRKIIHVAVGISSLFFPLIFSGPLPVLLLILVAIAVMLTMRRKKSQQDGLGSVLHSVSRPSYGEIYLAASVAILFFRSDVNPVLYVLPMLVITLSDAAAALVGTAYGRIRFAVEDGTKSIEGAIAFFMVTWICAMIVLLLMSDAGRVNVIILSILIAAFCTLVEADSWRGLDNLFVPIGAHLLLERYMGEEPLTLLLIASFFATMIFTVTRFSSNLGITKQEARSRTILIFLILTATTPLNTVIPFCAVFAHAFAQKFNRCESESPVLNLIAVSACVGLFWLVAGESIGTTVISLFTITFAGAAVVFATLAAISEDSRLWMKVALGPVILIVLGMSTLIILQNPTHAIWYDPIWPPILISLAISALVAWKQAAWFRQNRAMKAFGIAMIVPTILFFTDGVFYE